MGAGAFRKIEEYIHLIKGDIVEIGSEQERTTPIDGSTRYFAEIAKENNFNFYSVDFEQKAYERAKFLIGDNAFQMLGEDFLDRYEKSRDKIAFAYLDNFDFEYPQLIGSRLIYEQKKTYSGYGLELSNENSKMAHLIQTKKVVRHAAKTCIIVFDDTYINKNGDYDGKGGTAVPYLIKSGWHIIDPHPVLPYVMCSNKEIDK